MAYDLLSFVLNRIFSPVQNAIKLSSNDVVTLFNSHLEVHPVVLTYANSIV